MAWQTPKTWKGDDPLDNATLNREIRDNLVALHTQQQANSAGIALLHPNFAQRVKTIQSDQSLSVGDDIFGSPALTLTIRKSTAVVMAGIQATFDDISDPSTQRIDEFELRLRCYQERTPTPYTVDILDDVFIAKGGIISLVRTTVFPGFNAGTVTFTASFNAGGSTNLLAGSHRIWAMEL